MSSTKSSLISKEQKPPFKGGLEGLLFELIQVAIGNRRELTRLLSADEWAQLRLEFKKQALLGIGYCGIVRLPQAQCPPIQILAQWVHNAEKIRKKNERLTEECARVCETLRHDGIECCVLKGQSNLVNYRPSLPPLKGGEQADGKSPFKGDLEGLGLASYRTPGDIDLWCKAPAEGIQIASGTGKGAEYETYRGIAAIVEYAQMQCRLNGVPEVSWFDTLYYHIGIPWAGTGEKGKPTEVELHYRPSFLLNAFHNRRLQKWFLANEQFGMVRYAPFAGDINKNQKNPLNESDTSCTSAYSASECSNSDLARQPQNNPTGSVGTSDSSKVDKPSAIASKTVSSIPIPTNSFNAVYQLVHLYRHLFEEGIGLRQLLDYYFVLKTLPTSLHREGKEPDHMDKMMEWVRSTGKGEISREEIMHQLKRFGLGKFASAVMYVLQEAFNMPDVYLLCEPNEKEGRFLLNEIMLAGNFGKYDDRIKHGGSQLSHAWEKTKHNMRLLTHYPVEVMWEPAFRVYHWLWRKLELWRF